MHDLGYWWPFARTAWGWTVATVGGLAAIYYGPKKMLETYDWYMDRFFDYKVREQLENGVTLASYGTSAGGRIQSATPMSVEDIAKAVGYSEKRVRNCLKRLSRNKEVMRVGGDVWKLVIPHILG
jgi:hypothetical protein